MTYYQIDGMIGNELGAVAQQSSSVQLQPRRGITHLPLLERAVNQAKSTQPDWIQKQRGVTQSKAAWMAIVHISYQYENVEDPVTALTAMAVNSMANLLVGADEQHRTLPDWFNRLNKMFELAHRV